MKKFSNVNVDTRKNQILKLRITEECNTLLNNISSLEKRNKSEIIREAIDLYLTKDVNDKDLIYSSMNDTKRKIEFIDKKIETLFQFFYFSLTTIFAGLPDISIHSKEEQNVITKNAVRRKNLMLQAFKKTIKEQPSLFQMLLADYFEEENNEDN